MGKILRVYFWGEAYFPKVFKAMTGDKGPEFIEFSKWKCEDLIRKKNQKFILYILNILMTGLKTRIQLGSSAPSF